MQCDNVSISAMYILLGIFHNVSEDTHWGEFLNVSIHYIRARYPVPWDKVCF